MEELRQYRVVFTQTAMSAMREKALFISRYYLDNGLAREWYRRLRYDLEKELSYLPYKFPVYNQGQWQGQGVHVFTIRNDIVLYEIDEDNAAVYIRNIFTRGKDLTRD